MKIFQLILNLVFYIRLTINISIYYEVIFLLDQTKKNVLLRSF